MADEIIKRDQNRVVVLAGVTDDSNQYITMLRIDPTTKRLLISATGLPGGGTVTTVSVATANGISGTVANATTTPAITLTLGNITPSGVQVSGLTASQLIATDASKNLVSLDTATYPSLTELSYVKGVTSSIQTQLNGKQASGSYLTSSTGITVDQTSGQTLGTTGARLTKLWVTDITCTNAISGSVTGNAGTVTGLTFVSGKTLTVNNILTLAGTDSTTMTFPSTSATIARTDTAQTFTGTQTFSQIVTTNNAITATGNAATVPITSRISTVTNNSAATLTITITTTSAVDGQMVMVRILDASAVAQTITWVNTENSTVTAPTTSNGSTTLPLTVGFQYNANTSKWRCIALA